MRKGAFSSSRIASSAKDNRLAAGQESPRPEILRRIPVECRRSRWFGFGDVRQCAPGQYRPTLTRNALNCQRYFWFRSGIGQLETDEYPWRVIGDPEGDDQVA